MFRRNFSATHCQSKPYDYQSPFVLNPEASRVLKERTNLSNSHRKMRTLGARATVKAFFKLSTFIVSKDAKKTLVAPVLNPFLAIKKPAKMRSCLEKIHRRKASNPPGKTSAPPRKAPVATTCAAVDAESMLEHKHERISVREVCNKKARSLLNASRDSCNSVSSDRVMPRRIRRVRARVFNKPSAHPADVGASLTLPDQAGFQAPASGGSIDLPREPKVDDDWGSHTTKVNDPTICEYQESDGAKFRMDQSHYYNHNGEIGNDPFCRDFPKDGEDAQNRSGCPNLSDNDLEKDPVIEVFHRVPHFVALKTDCHNYIEALELGYERSKERALDLAKESTKLKADLSEKTNECEVLTTQIDDLATTNLEYKSELQRLEDEIELLKSKHAQREHDYQLKLTESGGVIKTSVLEKNVLVAEITSLRAIISEKCQGLKALELKNAEVIDTHYKDSISFDCERFQWQDKETAYQKEISEMSRRALDAESDRDGKVSALEKSLCQAKRFIFQSEQFHSSLGLKALETEEINKKTIEALRVELQFKQSSAGSSAIEKVTAERDDWRSKYLLLQEVVDRSTNEVQASGDGPQSNCQITQELEQVKADNERLKEELDLERASSKMLEDDLRAELRWHQTKIDEKLEAKSIFLQLLPVSKFTDSLNKEQKETLLNAFERFIGTRAFQRITMNAAEKEGIYSLKDISDSLDSETQRPFFWLTIFLFLEESQLRSLEGGLAATFDCNLKKCHNLEAANRDVKGRLNRAEKESNLYKETLRELLIAVVGVIERGLKNEESRLVLSFLERKDLMQLHAWLMESVSPLLVQYERAFNNCGVYKADSSFEDPDSSGFDSASDGNSSNLFDPPERSPRSFFDSEHGSQ